MMGVSRALLKLPRVLAHVVGGWWTITVHFPGWTVAQRAHAVQHWAAGLLRILAVALTVARDIEEGDEGRVASAASERSVLRVCNHISWLDILVIHAAGHCRFVSKAQVHGWPVIGTLAAGGGTLFIERESRRDAMRVVHHMADSLRAGDVLMVFPEGTTSDGTGVLPFHANLIQAAISADCAVQALGLRYTDCTTGRVSTAASYVGDDSLLGSVWRTLSAPRFEAVLRFGVPEFGEGRSRRQWAHDLHDVVQALRAAPLPGGSSPRSAAPV
jgi:1-acyl-sn-glycerol-3-phosphate acyltransferase